MKKIIVSALAASMMLLGTSAFAQVSVGAGYLNSTSKVTYGSSQSSTPMNGFYAGLGYDIEEGSGLGVSVGAYYSYIMNNSSASTSILGISVSGTSKVEEMYLDIPVNLKFSTALGSGVKAFIFAGPTFSYGISSTTDSEASIAGLSLGNSGKYDNYSGGDYGRFDILVGGGLGIDYGSIRFKVGYNVGMLNRLGDDSSYKQTRNVLQAGIAFLF